MAHNTTFNVMPAEVFTSKVELFRGPEVQILVGVEKKLFCLPKALLCYRSTYFDRAFNGSFKEATEQKMHIPETSVKTFHYAVQFLYTGTITIPSTEKGSALKSDDINDIYLKFFKVCDLLDLHGIEELVAKFKSELVSASSKQHYPTCSNIRDAMELPPMHGARRLTVEACIKPFAKSVLSSATPKDEYHSMITESDSFAADLFRAYTQAIQGYFIDYRYKSPLLGVTVDTRI